MKTARLESMVRGWFVGNFSPTLFHSEAFEVAVQNYRAGDVEAAHYHKTATEITVVIVGEVEMNGQRFRCGDIVVMEPGEITDFRAITDATTTAVKIPCVANDKYLA